MDLIIGLLFVIASIVVILLDIDSTKKMSRIPVLQERNRLFVDMKTGRILIGKMILYKSTAFLVISAIAFSLYWFADAGFFAFFVYIGMTFVHIPTIRKNYRLIRENS